MIEEEIQEIFKQQRIFGNKISEDFAKEYIKIYQFRAKPDPKMIANMVGKCTLEPKELRAPKESISFEVFQILQTFNNLKIEDKVTGEVFVTNNQHRKQILSLAKKHKEVKFSQIRKELKVPENFKFTNVRSTKKDATNEAIEKENFAP